MRGEVTDKRGSDSGATIEVDLEGLNQRGETVVEGSATTDLPTKKHP